MARILKSYLPGNYRYAAEQSGLEVCFNRQADKLYMCKLAHIVNVRAPLLQTDGPEGKQCLRTTVYYVFALFKVHRAKKALRVEIQNSSSSEISVSASRVERELFLTCVNTRTNADLHMQCSPTKDRPAGAGAQILHSEDRNAFNGFDHPDLISPQPHPVQIDGENLRIDLPRLSVITVSAQLA